MKRTNKIGKPITRLAAAQRTIKAAATLLQDLAAQVSSMHDTTLYLYRNNSPYLTPANTEVVERGQLTQPGQKRLKTDIDIEYGRMKPERRTVVKKSNANASLEHQLMMAVGGLIPEMEQLGKYFGNISKNEPPSAPYQEIIAEAIGVFGGMGNVISQDLQDKQKKYSGIQSRINYNRKLEQMPCHEQNFYRNFNGVSDGLEGRIKQIDTTVAALQRLDERLAPQMIKLAR